MTLRTPTAPSSQPLFPACTSPVPVQRRSQGQASAEATAAPLASRVTPLWLLLALLSGLGSIWLTFLS